MMVKGSLHTPLPPVAWVWICGAAGAAWRPDALRGRGVVFW
jgi:hypothetical protein